MHYLDYNENKRHGTPEFPVEYYYIDERHPRYQMPFHWHREYEIIRIKEGIFPITLDDEVIAASAGDVVFIRDGVLHGGTPQGCVYECVVFDLPALLYNTETLRRYIRQITERKILLFHHFTKTDVKICRAVRQLCHALAECEEGYELSAVGALYTLFALVFKNRYFTAQTAGASHTKGKADQLKPVLVYMEAHYSSVITLDILAGLAGMSAKYFCRYFRSSFHQTPMEYLNYYRIERACLELSATDESVTDIGFNCGFHDTAYFIRIFKRFKGVTPMQYRKAL